MRIIDVFICKIRSKLAAGGVPDLIRTVWTRGYIISNKDSKSSDPAQVLTGPDSTTQDVGA